MSEDKLLVFCVCEFVSEESFPMVLEFCRAAHTKKKKKKPDSESFRRSIVGERISRLLCKRKPFKAE